MSIKESGPRMRKPRGSVEAGFIDISPEIITKAVVNEIGIEKVPSRPFLSRAIDKHKKEIYNFVIKLVPAVIAGRMSNSELLKKTGVFVKELIITEIDTASAWAKPLAASTLARKRGKQVLVETREMRNSVSYKVDDAD